MELEQAYTISNLIQVRNENLRYPPSQDRTADLQHMRLALLATRFRLRQIE